MTSSIQNDSQLITSSNGLIIPKNGLTLPQNGLTTSSKDSKLVNIPLLTSTKFIQNNYSKLSNKEKALEWLKCKQNVFYFIFNYVTIPEIGGVLKYESSLMHDKIKRTVRSIIKYHKALLMASRQLGKSTVAACLLEWAANFYPRTPAIILNANKSFALENLQKIKFIHQNLPKHLAIPLKYKGDRKTYLEYTHGSIIRVFYPSSNTSADTLARSLTSPILYIDEGAFIRHMEEAFGSAQPTLSKAREQAKKNNYPYFILLTSTPNGTVGDGKWFYDMFSYSVDSDVIFKDEHFRPESDVLVDNPERNGFIKIKYHWSEDPTKDQAWYLEQCRDLNFNKRLINQELDLLFVGSTTCIFDDDYLAQLKSVAPYNLVTLPHATHLSVYTETFDMNDFYLVGADTAKSIVGDYSAIEIFSYASMVQIAEYFGRLGSLTKYSEVLMAVIQYLVELTNGRVILCVENNSIGTAVIENLENATDYDYMQYLYTPTTRKLKQTKGQIIQEERIENQYGVNTNKSTKDSMVSFLYDYIVNDPQNIKSSDLISQLNIIERSVNGSIRAQHGSHDDLFMSAALCAYVRRISTLEYEPLIGVPIYIQQQETIKKVTDVMKVISPSDLQSIAGQMVYREEEGGYEITFGDEKEDISNDMFSIF